MADTHRVTPLTPISNERPLIVLQTSNRFGDSDEEWGDRTHPLDEAAKHGREAVRVWKETVPDDIKPFVQLQMEVRTRDHVWRYDSFRRVFDELERAGISANFQFADPHDLYVFDPEYVEKLTQEYSCIKSYTMTEMRFEHYDTFNVPRYAMPAETRYAIDIIRLAARYGRHVVLSLQDLKWMHIGADEMNQPLVDTVFECGDYVIPVNEHIGPKHLQRQTSVWGFWIAGAVAHWGIEPQSWWFENARMITPGLFGQREPDNTRIMPPELYRAMILQGAMMGATAYVFEPFWDLFDYDNAHCWLDVIYPTLMEAIDNGLIPTREQVMRKTKVAFQYKLARTIDEFHENLRDIDWISNEGLFCEAAYGLWARYLEHELIPNKSRHFFIPLLPPKTPQSVLDHFERIVTPGTCDSIDDYESLLAEHYPCGDGEGNASIMSINGHTFVMQTHENLYEKQDYAIDLPKPVRGLRAERTPEGLLLSWTEDPDASIYHVFRTAGQITMDIADTIALAGHAAKPFFLDTGAEPGQVYTYTVTANTSSIERRYGTVNYLDYLVFSLTTSVPDELLTIFEDGRTEVFPVPEAKDTRPDSQVVYPTFDGATGRNRELAEAIVARIDHFKTAYEAKDWRAVTELYSEKYEDPNGFHREYVGRAWKWWLQRNNRTCMLRQIRYWNFDDYERTGEVHVHMFSLFRANRRDDQPFGYGYDGTLRIPRHPDEEVTYTWLQESDGAWRIVRTNPALPNLEEILWNNRGCDDKRKLRPGIDD